MVLTLLSVLIGCSHVLAVLMGFKGDGVPSHGQNFFGYLRSKTQKRAVDLASVSCSDSERRHNVEMVLALCRELCADVRYAAAGTGTHRLHQHHQGWPVTRGNSGRIPQKLTDHALSTALNPNNNFAFSRNQDDGKRRYSRIPSTRRITGPKATPTTHPPRTPMAKTAAYPS